jgi:hypothetical protein
MTNGGGVAAKHGLTVNGRGGRFLATDNLTDKQSAFVRAYVRNGGNAEAAARAAGYGDRARGYDALRNPKVIDAVRRERQRYIDGELASIAAGTMKALMVDESTPAATKYQAAKWCLEQAGHNSQQIQGLIADDRPMQEWTLDQLQAFISAGAAVLADVADKRRAIDVTPVSADNAQDNAQSEVVDDVLA